MKAFYNSTSHEYYREGNTITKYINGKLFSGIPSEEQLKEWDFEEIDINSIKPNEVSERDQAIQNYIDRLKEIEKELKDMDYLTSKYIDGEDMSEYGDWKGHRKELRSEYRDIENALNDIYDEVNKEHETETNDL